jgi:hypothetical protein
MIPFQAYVINQHIEDLRAQAKARRFARAARDTRRPGQPRPPLAGLTESLSFLPRLRNWPYPAR